MGLPLCEYCGAETREGDIGTVHKAGCYALSGTFAKRQRDARRALDDASPTLEQRTAERRHQQILDALARIAWLLGDVKTDPLKIVAVAHSERTNALYVVDAGGRLWGALAGHDWHLMTVPTLADLAREEQARDLIRQQVAGMKAHTESVSGPEGT